MEAIKQQNEKDFSVARHNIGSYIKLFNLDRLDENLQSISKLLRGDVGDVPEDIIHQVQSSLSKLVTSIEQEIKKIRS
jgi:hypothetical protein